MTFRHIAITALVLALTATACGSDSEKKESSSLQDQITVSGDYGEKPTIEMDAPVKVDETTSWTTVEGKGDKVGSEATTILALTIANARTGKTAISTNDEGQRPLEIKLGEQVFPALTDSLVGQSAGSRVVIASTPDDAYGDQGASQIGIKAGDPIVLVADILSTDPTSVLEGPTGATNDPPATAPKILVDGNDLTGLDFSGLKKPKKYQAIVLREGTGPEVEVDRIAADYIGQVWGAKEPFNNSYGKEPVQFSIGLGGVIPAWDKGLTGMKEGARVMLICPPETAYGKAAQPGIPANSTLVFVIDVLGVG